VARFALTVPSSLAAGERWLLAGEHRTALRRVPAEDWIARAVCSPVARPGQVCQLFEVEAPLAPNEDHRLADQGGALGAAPLFRTGADVPAPPLELSASGVRADGCLVARATSSVSAAVVLRVAGPAGATGELPWPAVGSPSPVPFVLPPPFTGDQPVTWWLEGADWYGHWTQTAVQSERGVPLSLAITELLPNPLGPEPTTEFVEVRNLGPAAVDLGGLLLDDGGGQPDTLPAASIPPNGYAVIVPVGYVAAAAREGAPAAGAVVVRVDSSLATSGLANAGEPLRLRFADGRVVSSYGGYENVSAAERAGRSVVRVGDTACDVAESFRLAERPTPGAPNL
jgi:hypothetical protein